MSYKNPPTTWISIFPTGHDDEFEVRGTWSLFPDRDSIITVTERFPADCTLKDAFEIVSKRLGTHAGAQLVEEGLFRG